MLKIKRIYDGASPDDGFRVLVDRLWPRGISKEKAHIDLWAKDVAPSNELRKEFHAHEDTFEMFRTAYRAELKANPSLPAFSQAVKEHLAQGNVTFITAVKDTEHSHVEILVEAVGAE